MVGQLYIGRVPKGEIAATLGCSKQTITRDVKWLKQLWVKELIRDPVEHQARTLATLQMLEQNASAKFISTGSPRWWDRWMQAVQAISKFLGLDAPVQVDRHLERGVNFTVEFETPDGRILDADEWSVMQLESAEDGQEE